MSDIPRFTAPGAVAACPPWALKQRQLIHELNESIEPFLARYVRDDRLIWSDTWSGSRDGADDFYESAHNWPLLYLLGGDERLRSMGQRLWDGITAQLTELGPVLHEYERGYDQFHQSESYIYFYYLCLADAGHARNRARARRFAGLYMDENPAAPNYDPALRLIRAPHNGSGGPRWGYTDADPARYAYAPGMARYGLPYLDVPGVRTYGDLRDPDKAIRMGTAMQARMGRGDVVGNLAVTSLITNAWLLTGEEKYRAWVLSYLEAWHERAARNGGLVPDNTGLSDTIGEYIEGRWYGGLYGWAWPHGYYNIGQAVTVACTNACLLTGDTGYLELARTQYDRIMELGEWRRVDPDSMSIASHWIDQFRAAPDDREHMFLVPYRHNEDGWFDWQPMGPMYPFALWNVSGAAEDRARIQRLQDAEKLDWSLVFSYRTKEDSGHEKPWLMFLEGQNPGYPEQILDAALEQVAHRRALIQADTADLTQVHIHHWQQHNPVTTEALVQLTLGAPQPLYNGGLLHAPVRYFDDRTGRPGLPPNVAVLVSGRDGEQLTVEAVNTSREHHRILRIQAGGFGEHEFSRVEIQPALTVSDPSGSPAQSWTGSMPQCCLELPPAHACRAVLTLNRFVGTPAYIHH